MVSKEKIEKFKQLYHTKFNVIVTDKEATQMAYDLVNHPALLTNEEFKRLEPKNES